MAAGLCARLSSGSYAVPAIVTLLLAPPSSSPPSCLAQLRLPSSFAIVSSRTTTSVLVTILAAPGVHFELRLTLLLSRLARQMNFGLRSRRPAQRNPKFDSTRLDQRSTDGHACTPARLLLLPPPSSSPLRCRRRSPNSFKYPKH